MASFFDIGAIFVAVAATGAQLYQGKKAEKASKRVVEAQNKATAEQRKSDELNLRRTKIKAIQEARIRRGQAKNAAVAQGAQGSVQGGFESITSQLTGTFNLLDQSSIFARNASGFLSEAGVAQGQQASAMQSANIFSGVASAGFTIFDRRADIKGLFA